MHNIFVGILLVLVAQALAKKPVQDGSAQSSVNNLVDKLASKLVNKLLVRGIQELPLDHQKLDKTTLQKPSKPNTSNRPGAYATSWKHGQASQQLVKAGAAAAPPPTAPLASELAKADTTTAAKVPRVASSVALRGRDMSDTVRKLSVCGLQCDFSGLAAFAKPLSLTYQYHDSPLDPFSGPWKTSCEFEGECPNLPFQSSAVGTYSYQGMKPTPRSMKYKNQDRGSVVYPFAGSPQQAFFAVYDGHGDGGEMVSEYTMRVVQDTLEKQSGLVGNEAAAFEIAFLEADRQVLAMEKLHRNWQSKNRGTTALAALLRGNQVWVANAGDSRCVLASKSVGGAWNKEVYGGIKVNDLSTDQKPNSPGEQERIKHSGGYIRLPDSPDLPARVYPPHMVDEYPGLAVSRAIGDYALKDSGVIASPEVKVYDLNDDDLFMILASDGIWEFISSQEAAEIVWGVLQEGGDATKATEILVENASDRWQKEEGGHYRDDITAIVVALPLFKHVTGCQDCA